MNKIECSGSVEVHGNSGSIDCGGSCTVDGEVKGNIDAGGFIKNNYGQIIKKIDFDTGKEINGFSKLLKSSKANKVTVDVFGELVEITDDASKAMKPLTKKTVKGVVTYLDSANNSILKEYDGIDGKYATGTAFQGRDGGAS